MLAGNGFVLHRRLRQAEEQAYMTSSSTTRRYTHVSGIPGRTDTRTAGVAVPCEGFYRQSGIPYSPFSSARSSGTCGITIIGVRGCPEHQPAMTRWWQAVVPCTAPISAPTVVWRPRTRALLPSTCNHRHMADYHPLPRFVTALTCSERHRKWWREVPNLPAGVGFGMAYKLASSCALQSSAARICMPAPAAAQLSVRLSGKDRMYFSSCTAFEDASESTALHASTSGGALPGDGWCLSGWTYGYLCPGRSALPRLWTDVEVTVNHHGEDGDMSIFRYDGFIAR